MKKIVGIILALSMISSLSGCAKAISVAVERDVLLSKQKEFNSNYAKEHPEAVSIVNRYIDCLNGKESAIEGCELHVSKNDADKDLLSKYLQAREQFLTKLYNKQG